MNGSLVQLISDIAIQSVHKVAWTWAVASEWRSTATSGDVSATTTYNAVLCVCMCVSMCMFTKWLLKYINILSAD